MRKEEIAYREGFRMYKDGVLYNIDGRLCRITINRKTPLFSFTINRKQIRVQASRFQAFLKYGKLIYDYRYIRLLDGNQLNYSYTNIGLGRGVELLSSVDLNLPLLKQAFNLGYRVSIDGNLILKGINVNHKLYLNNRGYFMFSIPAISGQTKNISVHRLQAFQKFGEKTFSSKCVRHLNNNKLDNSCDNIAIGTHAENYNDRDLTTKAQQYLKVAHKNIKYPIPLRNKIRRLHLKKLTIREISDRVEVPYKSVYEIVSGRTIV